VSPVLRANESATDASEIRRVINRMLAFNKEVNALIVDSGSIASVKQNVLKNA